MEPASKRVLLDTGLAYHYLEWDQSESKHTLVLVHGFLDSSAGFREMAQAGLTEHFHIIAPDMRGHGDSDRVGAGGYYHFFDYVADLRSFIVALGREKVSLLGHSMGGSIAGYYAGSYPDSLFRLALLEGMGPPEDLTPVPERVSQWIRGWNHARVRPPQVYASVEVAAQKLLDRDDKLSPELALKLAEWGTRPVPEGRVFKHDPLHLTLGPVPYSIATAGQFWQRITCPVLLVEGGDSTLKPSEEEHARRSSYLQNKRSVSIPAAGHMLQRHAPVELAGLLADFLR